MSKTNIGLRIVNGTTAREGEFPYMVSKGMLIVFVKLFPFLPPVAVLDFFWGLNTDLNLDIILVYNIKYLHTLKVLQEGLSHLAYLGFNK